VSGAESAESVVEALAASGSSPEPKLGTEEQL
jgi:hypothetical protein